MSKSAREASAVHRALTAHVRREMRGGQDVDDIVQESWLRMVKAERGSRPVENFAAYLRRIESPHPRPASSRLPGD